MAVTPRQRVDQAVNEHAFSDLYTYVARETNVPRHLVKQAIICVFCGVNDSEAVKTWDYIQTHFRSKALAVLGDES